MNPELTFDAKTITRSRGSWIDDGFKVDDRITIHGGTVNQGQFRVTAVTATVLTLELDDSTPFVKEMLRDVEINRLLPYEVVEQPDDPLNLGDLAQTLLDKLTGTGILGLAGFWAMVMQQSPSSTLTITGADIQATGNVTATATTNSQLRLRTDSLWIGVNYGRSDATATLTVGSGTRIVAGAAVQLATNITNELRVGAIVTTGINARLIYAMKVATDKGGLLPGPALTAAVGEASSQSNTTVTAGAVIEAATVTISANNSNDFQVTATSAVRGLAKANTGVAIAVVVSNDRLRRQRVGRRHDPDHRRPHGQRPLGRRLQLRRRPHDAEGRQGPRHRRRQVEAGRRGAQGHRARADVGPERDLRRRLRRRRQQQQRRPRRHRAERPHLRPRQPAGVGLRRGQRQVVRHRHRHPGVQARRQRRRW